MWISSVTIDNVRGFGHAKINFSKSINILVGPNSSGKSTILRSISLIQPFDGKANQHRSFQQNYLRYGTQKFKVSLTLKDLDANVLLPKFDYKNEREMFVEITPLNEPLQDGRPLPLTVQGADKSNSYAHNAWLCNLQEPNNFLFPFFSQRKPIEFNEQISTHTTNLVEETFSHIYAKIDRLLNSPYPEAREFRQLCEQILGFEISCHASGSGKQAGLAVSRNSHIAISAMGEGTVNLLAFMSHVLVSEGKLFLIEELENDLHPKALKALLELIIKKSETNQFIISTHNNIVLKCAGAVPEAKLFSIGMKLENRIPASSISEVPNTPESRIKVLEDLGYDLFDFELWKAYLILEESSAQSVIEQVLIPLFAENLGPKMKIIAASGNMDVEARFSDFLRLFVFIHKSSPYKDHAWVAVDGDDEGKGVIQRLQAKFDTWSKSNFRTFTQPAFEHYYPSEFQDKASAILAMPKSLKKREEKTQLALDVIAWAKKDENRAKSELPKSAGEIIEFLQQIEKVLKGNH